MRVAFVSQLPLSLAYGGLEIQLVQTAEALVSLGVQVEFLDPWKRHLDVDLLHCFGSEYQFGEIVAHAKGKRMPIIVSAIFVPSHSWRNYLVWKYVDHLIPMKTSFGVRRQILRTADAIIAYGHREALDLVRIFGIDRKKVHTIAVGVDDRFFAAAADEFEAKYGMKEFVLCVGSIERRKNQHRLIDALNGTGLSLVLIGPRRSTEVVYANEVADRVRHQPDVLWIEGLPHESPLLVSAFGAARVHALPSLSEGQPLVVAQAAAAGANLVVSDLPHLREALGTHAWYCNPRSIHSIHRAILDAYSAPRGAGRGDCPPLLVSWRDVALKLQKVYEFVLEGRAYESNDADASCNPPGSLSTR